MFSLQLSPNEQKEFQDWRDKQYNEIVEKVNKTAYERFKKETKKYEYIVKEQLISISISFKSHNFKIVDDKCKIIRYPIYNYVDVIFNNEEEANKHIEKRKKK